VPRAQLGVATSAGQFFRQVGSTVGVAVFGAVLTHNLAEPPRRSEAAPAAQVQTLSLADLEKLAMSSSMSPQADAVDPAVRETVTEAILGVIFAGFVVCLLGFTATLAVPALPLQARIKPEAVSEAPGEPPSGQIES
jgi:hypothetical protein